MTPFDVALRIVLFVVIYGVSRLIADSVRDACVASGLEDGAAAKWRVTAQRFSFYLLIATAAFS